MGQLLDVLMPQEPVRFRSYDPQANVEISERKLPHWFQPGVAIFVTFRTADSLPKDLILRWQNELEAWLRIHELPEQLAASTVHQNLPEHDQLLSKLTVEQQKNFKRLTNRLFNHCLDECHGACVLRQTHLAEIVAECLRFFDGQRYDLDRFVVMPNHVHAIVQFRQGFSLETISQSWMRYSARQINQQLGLSGAFWQPEPFDHLIRSPEQFEYLQRYIAENPTKAKLKPKEFFYWTR